MNIIEVNGLTKTYKNVVAVDNISLEVEKGSIFGLIGPNGAGKTTTVECLTGVRKYDRGKIKVLDYDPKESFKKLSKYIGVQFQETSYQNKIKVYEICGLFTSMYDKPLDYRLFLERFGLADKLKCYLSHLSGGQRQKIAIILALISNPEIIFLDELTTGLDPKSRREMWDFIKALKAEGKTIFMTTHYMDEAEYLCDKIGIINEGKIVVSDDVDGVIDFADLDFIISFETESDILNLLKENITGIDKIESTDNGVKIYTKTENLLTHLILFLHERKIAFRKIDIRRPNLEDAYLKLIGTKREELL